MHTEDAAFEENLLQYCTVSVRSTLQNFAKHNWMKIFTLTSSVFAKVSLGSAIAGTMQNECKIESFRSVSAPKCRKIALFASATRDQWKFLLRTVKRRHCPFKFFYASCYINNLIWVLIGCCWQYVLKIGSFMECCQSNIDHVTWCDCARKEYAQTCQETVELGLMRSLWVIVEVKRSLNISPIPWLKLLRWKRKVSYCILSFSMIPDLE